MFDLYHSPPSSIRPASAASMLANPAADRPLPFVLTTASRDPGAALAGEAAYIELDRFDTLADAMLSAVTVAGQTALGRAPQMLAIVDRDRKSVV